MTGGSNGPAGGGPTDGEVDDDPTGAESSAGTEETAAVEERSYVVTERSTEEGLLVSLCDDDVLGEHFENGDVTLTVTEEFYAGESVDEAAAIDSLARATVANIVGDRSVEVAIENGFVDENIVLDVGETRHAQLLRM